MLPLKENIQLYSEYTLCLIDSNKNKEYIKQDIINDMMILIEDWLNYHELSLKKSTLKNLSLKGERISKT